MSVCIQYFFVLPLYKKVLVWPGIKLGPVLEQYNPVTFTQN